MKKLANKEQVLFSVAGFLTGTLLVCVGALVIYLLGDVHWVASPPTVSRQSGSILDPESLSRQRETDLFIAFIFVLLVAAAEEYIFRGFILRRLGRKINVWLALFISSALFAAVHLMNADITPLAIVNIFLGGLVFGITYMLTRSIVYVIFFHFGWNFIQGPILGFAVSGLPFESLMKIAVTKNNLINGGAFGFEGSIICSIILFITFLFAVIFIEK